MVVVVDLSNESRADLRPEMPLSLQTIPPFSQMQYWLTEFYTKTEHVFLLKRVDHRGRDRVRSFTPQNWS